MAKMVWDTIQWPLFIYKDKKKDKDNDKYKYEQF